ncbi:MAG: pyridoxal-phosphate dependent enzyme, partial [Candidatus Edwardsbacteria bacterium]|nr:pyridoxal-phosphate dependent enzyme [Candidatus Edwardsbacteria bacterium]
SISVTAPSNAHLARHAVLESGGFSLTVGDGEIRRAQALMARTAGVFAEPAAAAAAAGLAKAATSGKLKRNGRIVLLVTGHGLKDIDAPLARIVLPQPIPPRLGAVKGL